MPTSSLIDDVAAAVALLRPRAPRLLAAIGLGMVSLGSALALAGVAAWLIARAWQMPPILDLTVAVVAVRALGIARGVLGYCERLAIHDVALRAAGQARVTLYRRLAGAHPDAVLRWRSGDLTARLGATVDDLADVVVRAVLPIAVAGVLGVAAVVAIAAIAPAAAAVLAAGLLVAGVLAPWLTARAAAAEERVAVAHRAARDAAALLALEHAPELRVAGRLDAVVADADRRQRAWGAAADRAARLTAVASAVPTLALGAGVLAAVYSAIALGAAVAPTTAAILMLLPLSSFEATAALPAAGVHLMRARIALRQLDEVTADPGGRDRPAVAVPPVRAGERLVVVGPSGAGKTTTLLAIAAEHAAAAGFFGEDAHLFATTVRDNLKVARGDVTDAEAVAALAAVGLGDWLADLPDGLDTVLTGGAEAVSGGQRRRLLLARAVVSTFPVVLLDEPTEHLAAADADRVLRELLRPGGLFAADRAVVVATHHLPPGVDCPVVTVGADEYARLR